MTERWEVAELLRFGGPIANPRIFGGLGADHRKFGGLRIGDDGRWSDQSHRRAGETRSLPPGSQTTVGRGDAEADGPSRWAGENGEARRCTGSPSVSQGSTAPPCAHSIRINASPPAVRVTRTFGYSQVPLNVRTSYNRWNHLRPNCGLST